MLLLGDSFSRIYQTAEPQSLGRAIEPSAQPPGTKSPPARIGRLRLPARRGPGGPGGLHPHRRRGGNRRAPQAEHLCRDPGEQESRHLGVHGTRRGPRQARLGGRSPSARNIIDCMHPGSVPLLDRCPGNAVLAVGKPRPGSGQAVPHGTRFGAGLRSPRTPLRPLYSAAFALNVVAAECPGHQQQNAQRGKKEPARRRGKPPAMLSVTKIDDRRRDRRHGAAAPSMRSLASMKSMTRPIFKKPSEPVATSGEG